MLSRSCANPLPTSVGDDRDWRDEFPHATGTAGLCGHICSPDAAAFRGTPCTVLSFVGQRRPSGRSRRVCSTACTDAIDHVHSIQRVGTATGQSAQRLERGSVRPVPLCLSSHSRSMSPPTCSRRHCSRFCYLTHALCRVGYAGVVLCGWLAVGWFIDAAP
jgi:hypothetical protein